jgi:hypothetical protein
MKALATGAVIIVAVLNIASAQEPTATDEWITIRPTEGRYHVRMPPGWQEDSQRYTNGLSFRPSKSSALADEFVNCKARAEANPAIATSTQASLDAAVAAGPAPPNAVAEMLATVGQEAVVRENGLMQVSGHPAYFIVVSGARETASAWIHVVAAELVLVRPGRMYSLACTAGAGSADQAEHAWTTWRPIFIDIMSTFDSESR